MMRIRHSLGAVLLLAGLAGCGGSPPPPAPAQRTAELPPGHCDRRFTLHNRSSREIAEFYFRPAGGSEWGTDRFGSRLLSRGHSISFRVIGEGRRDLRIVFANGEARQLMGVNLCEVGLVAAEDAALTPR